MKKITILFVLIACIGIKAQTTYYVSNSGNDNSSGTSENSAWKTISKINSVKLNYGDIIAFKAGDTFTGQIIASEGVTYTSYGVGRAIFKNPENSRRSFIIDKRDVTIKNIEIENAQWIKVGPKAHHTKISGCYFHHVKSPGDLEASANNSLNQPLWIIDSDYFVLENSIIEGNYNSSYQDMILIEGNSQFSLVENNYIDGGSHTSLYYRGYFRNENDVLYNDDSPHHNIIRNNHFYNHSHHVLTVQRGAWMTLIEGNYFERSGTGIDSSDYYSRKYADDGTIGSAIYWSGDGIIRNNIIRRSGKVANYANRAIGATSSYATGNNRYQVWNSAIYNNSFWGNWSEHLKTGISGLKGFPELKYENISVINNSFGGIVSSISNDIWIYRNNTSQNYTGEYRNNSFEEGFIGTEGSSIPIPYTSLNGLGEIIASGNIKASPLFKAPDGIPSNGDIKTAFNNFSLRSNSKLIDAGTFLTYTVSSGSNSNKVKVKDAKFFIDGWGIIDGDKIQIGNEVVQITSIDSENNTITVDRNISWSTNAGVSLPYSGNKPDIGAIEYGSPIDISNGSNELGLHLFLEGVSGGNFLPQDIITLNQPYKDNPWNHSGSESLASWKDDFVDWLLVELRSDLNTISYRKAGILKSNGIVVNADGSNFSFGNIQNGKYYLVIRHRNHLDVISAIPINVNTNSEINYDFTSSSNAAYGTNSLIELSNGKFAMIAGDSDANGVINNLDFGAVANSIPFEGYDKCDLDMNGVVNVLDYSFINKNILKRSYVSN